MIRRLWYAAVIAALLTFLCTAPFNNLQAKSSELYKIILSSSDFSAQHHLEQAKLSFFQARSVWDEWRPCAALYLREESLESIERAFYDGDYYLQQQQFKEFFLTCRHLCFLLNSLSQSEQLTVENLF